MPIRRTRPWTDRERRDCNWNDRHNRPVKSMACAAMYQVRVEKWPPVFKRRGPDHGKCKGVSVSPCACNCHFAWEDSDLVRLMDGRVGLCLGVLKEPEYMMVVHLGGDTEISVDIGEPVLMDQVQQS